MSDFDLDAFRRRVETGGPLNRSPGTYYPFSQPTLLGLLDTIDKQRLALKRGWTLAQYEYADAHDLWAANAGDGTADERWTR